MREMMSLGAHCEPKCGSLAVAAKALPLISLMDINLVGGLHAVYQVLAANPSSRQQQHEQRPSSHHCSCDRGLRISLRIEMNWVVDADSGSFYKGSRFTRAQYSVGGAMEGDGESCRKERK